MPAKITEQALQRFVNSNQPRAVKAMRTADLIETLIQTAWTDFSGGYDRKAETDIANIVKLTAEVARQMEAIHREAVNVVAKFQAVQGEKRNALRWPKSF